MRNKQFIMCFLLCVFCYVIMAGNPLFAQETVSEPVRLSPDEAVERAIKNNLSLESARVSSSTKKRASELSWNQFIPSVTAAGVFVLNNDNTKLNYPEGATLQGSPFPEDTKVTTETFRWGVGVQLQASFNLSLAMFENMKRLRLDYEGGLLSYEKAKLQLERDVRKAYNGMLMLQENINLLKESYAAAGRRVAMARANYNAGLAPELSLLQAQVAVENMKPMIDQAENGFRLSLAQFAMFLGVPYDTPFELIPMEKELEFIPLDVKEFISKAASGKPDVQELRHTILMLESARKVQARSLLPFLNISWSAPLPMFLWDETKTTISIPNVPSNLLPPSKPVPSEIRSLSNSLTITLGVRLHSLIPWSPDYQGVKNLDDQIKIANIGLAQMVRGTEIEIYNTILSLEKVQITTEVQAQTVSLAERAYRLTEEAYRAGLQDLLQVQSAELELKQAKVSMLEQQFNYINGLLDLEYSIGVPFGTLSKKEN